MSGERKKRIKKLVRFKGCLKIKLGKEMGERNEKMDGGERIRKNEENGEMGEDREQQRDINRDKDKTV